MKYFKYEEFDDPSLPSGTGKKFMCPVFLNNLDQLREYCGFPLIITSGYRSPEYNNKISSSGLKGAHTTGKAVDIAVDRQRCHKLLMHAFGMNVFTGIGVNQKGDKRFIHLDSLKSTEFEGIRPTIWSY